MILIRGAFVLLQIGFAIADQKEGEFELRVQWIKAVAQLENSNKSHNDDDDDDDRCVPFALSCYAETRNGLDAHMRACCCCLFCRAAWTSRPPSQDSRSHRT